MAFPDAIVLLRCPDIEFDLHGHLLGLIQETGQHGQRPPLFVRAPQIKALTLNCRLNRKYGLVAQCIGVEIRQPGCRELKGLGLQDRLRCRAEALMPNTFDPPPNLVLLQRYLLFHRKYRVVAEV